jgi:hypothetical protein
MCGLMVLQSASWAGVSLNFNTSPGSGVAGVSQVWVIGSGFPAGVINPGNVVVSVSTVCGAPPSATTTGLLVQTVLGTSRKVKFTVPASLATGAYFVAISDSVDAAAFTSNNCSKIQVTHTSSTLAACVPTSSLSLNAPVSGPASVTALVPNASWGSSTLGIKIVQLESGGGPVVPPISVATTNPVNSCAANPATAKGVCVANNTDVYTMDAYTGGPFAALTSGSNASTNFSGGSCMNCGVAVNALTNQAVIAMGHTGSSGSVLQTLDLGTNTFSTPFSLAHGVSEDISIDPTRGYVLSPSEFSSTYDLVQFNSTTGAFNAEFGNHVSSPSLTMDSAAEDCATGIALTVGEFSNTVYLADLTQATFVAGSPGTWIAPQAEPSIIGSYSSGLSGVTVAPGSSHLATVTGEFGGSSFSVLQLPATSGTGTPGIVDYAYVNCVSGFNAGTDPHTVSAYSSPNNGKAYTVFASSAPPTTLLLADMAAILAMPRNADGHTVTPTPGDSFGCLSTTAAPGNTVLRFVPTI